VVVAVHVAPAGRVIREAVANLRGLGIPVVLALAVRLQVPAQVANLVSVGQEGADREARARRREVQPHLVNAGLFLAKSATACVAFTSITPARKCEQCVRNIAD
jgi:hypothetical protein